MDEFLKRAATCRIGATFTRSPLWDHERVRFNWASVLSRENPGGAGGLGSPRIGVG